MIITDNIQLNEKSTKYVWDGQEFPRKSHCKINPFAMYNIGFYKGINCTLSRVLPNAQEEEVNAISTQVRNIHKEEHREKLERGLFFHQQMESCFQGSDIIHELNKIRTENPFANWILENFTEEKIRHAYSEQSFIDTQLQYGGTVDLIIDHILIDYKTGKKYDDHLVDAAAYFIPLKEKFQLKKVFYLYEIDFTMSNKIEVIDYTKYMPIAYDIFLAGLKYIETKKRLESEISIEKKEKKEEEKAFKKSLEQERKKTKKMKISKTKK